MGIIDLSILRYMNKETVVWIRIVKIMTNPSNPVMFITRKIFLTRYKTNKKNISKNGCFTSVSFMDIPQIRIVSNLSKNLSATDNNCL